MGVIEQTPVDKDKVLLMANDLSQRLLRFVGTELETTPHIHFYSLWCHVLVKVHGLSLKRTSKDIMPVLNLLQKNLLQKSKGLTEICENNKYTIQFLLRMAELKRAKSLNDRSIDSSSDSEEESDMPEQVENMELEEKWDDSD